MSTSVGLHCTMDVCSIDALEVANRIHWTRHIHKRLISILYRTNVCTIGIISIQSEIVGEDRLATVVCRGIDCVLIGGVLVVNGSHGLSIIGG